MKKIINNRFLPHVLMLIGALFFILGVIWIESGNILCKLSIIIGFFIFGGSGLPIVYSKKFYYLFFTLNNTLAILYGLFILIIGWLSSIAFTIDYFYR
jgi:hypothetical protein